MKKLMMLAAITAMTAGAFADELDPLRTTDGAYTFGLSITGIPQEYAKLSPDAGCYLVNRETKEIVAYVRCGDNTRDVLKTADQLYTKSGENPVTLGGVQYNFADQIKALHSENAISAYEKEDGTKTVTFKVGFQTSASEASLPSTLDDTVPTGGNLADLNLFGIVYDPGTQDGFSAYYQEFHGLTYSRSDGLFDTNGSEKYFNNVPEPTSAMLLLLGFAGLALKRKRVA